MRLDERGLQSSYELWELVEIANVSRHLMRKLLRLAGVQVQRMGRTVLVPLSEIEKKVPLLWDSLQVLQRARRTVEGAEQARGKAWIRGSMRRDRDERRGRS